MNPFADTVPYPKKKRPLHLLLPIFYAIAIFGASIMPIPVQNRGIDIPHIDKLLHFIGYGILAVLIFRAFIELGLSEKHLFKTMAAAIVLSALYGLSDEIHQSFVPHRTASFADFLADLAGSTAMVLLYEIYGGAIPRLWPEIRRYYHEKSKKIHGLTKLEVFYKQMISKIRSSGANR